MFLQGNVPASRKAVLPIIKSFVSNYKAENAHDSLDMFDWSNVKKYGTHIENATASATSLVDASMYTPVQFSPLSVNGSTGIESSSNQTTDFDWQSTTTENTNNSQANGHNDVDMVGVLEINQDAGNDTEIDFHPKTDDFIDNLIDTGLEKGGNRGQTHSNLQVSSDPASPGLESPMEFSSGHTSEQGSSYPATPPNSFMESNLESLVKDVGLPSFNSSEMVQRIRHKKESLAQSIDMENTDDLQNDNVPFTPPNSFAEGIFDMHAKEQHLPSFNSSDMVDKINKKKSALSQSLSTEDESKKSERFPYTPHNSLIEGAFDMHPQDTLPSFNNAEMIVRIKIKKASLVPLDESEDGAEILDDRVDRFDSSEGDKNNVDRTQTWSAPFTPHNSFVEANNIHRMAPLQKDVEQFANQLTQKIMSGGLDNDAQSNDEMFDMNIDDESVQVTGNFQLASTTNTAGEYQLASITNTAGEYQLASPTDSVKEIALSMTKDIILKALDTFPTTYGAEHTGNNNKTNSTEHVNNTEKEVNNSKTTSGISFQIETDYLPSLDPLRGNLDIVTSPESSTVLITDARKVIAESASFDKMLNDGKNIFRKLSEERQISSQLSLSNEHDHNTKSKDAECSEISTENMFNFDASDTFGSKDDSQLSSASSGENEISEGASGSSVIAPESEDSDTDFSSTTTEGSYRVNDSANASPQTERGHIMDIIKEVEDDESEVFDAKLQVSIYMSDYRTIQP